MRTLQTISNSIDHDIVSTFCAIIIGFNGFGVGHAYLLQTISNTSSIALDHVSTISTRIIAFDGAEVGSRIRLQTSPSNSIVRNDVSNVSAIILDFDIPGRGNAYFCKRFRIVSSIV